MLKALPMRRLPLSVAFGAVAMLVASGARADEEPVVAPVAVVPYAAPMRLALTTTSATSMGSLTVVLDVLGFNDDAPKPNVRTRTATWLQPEPPRTPLLYSSVVVAKF